MSMTYVPTWERKYDRWETEPDTTLDLSYDEENEEIEIEDVEISLDELAELEMEEEFDLE